MERYKVGVIGDLDSIIGFRALGMTVRPVADANEVLTALREMQAEEYAIIFLTEQFAGIEEVKLSLQNVSGDLLPAIILIPTASESARIGKEQLRQSVRKATGIDLLGEL